MIPWLLVMEMVSSSGKPLSQLVEAMVEAYPSPVEINRKIADPGAAIERVRQHYESESILIDTTDGISMEFADWRFNLRMSNTEPVVRLNLETRGDKKLLAERQSELLSLMESV
jgi:phosphomannomutase